MKRFHRACGLACVLLIAAAVMAPAQDYWPAETWRTSSPEEQGMNSDTLAALVEDIQDKNRNIRNIIVIRNGYVVLDVAFSPYPGNTPHIIHSCTKSITAALVGIAIDKGLIESVDEKVLDFFPDKVIANRDAAKEKMTLEHLLTMSTGLDCEDSYLYKWDGLRDMMQQPDWAGHVLGLPMKYGPGERFEYCNGASYLLSAILQKTTGMSTLEFARDNLFGPLGIDGVEWSANREGVNTGWGNMLMRPHDLAKIGYLFLNKGEWRGEQVVSREWVEESTKSHIIAGTLSDSYGYQIWPNEMGYYMMLGYAGQYVIVHPADKMVTVFTSCLKSDKFFVPRRLYQDFVKLSVVSSEPLSPEEAGTRRLFAAIDNAATPEQQEVPSLPGAATEISGKRFEFETNAAGFEWIQLDFTPGKREMTIEASFGFQNIHATVGLDGVYRQTHSGGQLQAYRGYWESENTFVLEFEALEQTRRGSARMVFDGDELSMHFQEVITKADRRLMARVRPED